MRQRGRAVHRQLIVLGAIMLVIGPLLLVAIPREVARWYKAAADEAVLNGNSHAAIAKLNDAIAWDARQPQYYLMRARCLLDTGQWKQGLADCDQARVLDADDLNVSVTRSQLLQHLGRHDEAIEELERLLDHDQLKPGQRANMLNSVAYARAVGDRQLDQGLEEVQKSLELIGTQVGMLDPTAFLSFQRGCAAKSRKEFELAQQHLADALARAETLLAREEQRWQALAYLPGQLEYAERVAVAKSFLLGVLLQRESVSQKLEQPQLAAETRERIDQLDPEGVEPFLEPSDLGDALFQLELTGNMLDTRGFLYYQAGELLKAQIDLQRATAIIDAVCDSYDWLLAESKFQVVDLRKLERSRETVLKAKAVIYYHLMLVHSALGMSAAADQDRAQVVELGYEPGDQLF